MSSIQIKSDTGNDEIFDFLITNIEPALCAGGINGYVKELFAYFI